jgi:hypothetical protein
MPNLKLSVIVSEGGSEKAFLASLIEAKFGYCPVRTRSPNCFKSHDSDVFWFLPIPSLGTTHSGGKSALKQKETYIRAELMVSGQSYLYEGRELSVHYYILTDTDNNSVTQIEKRTAQILKAVNGAGVVYDSCEVIYAHSEIECWFMAGLTEDFSSYSNGGYAKLQRQQNAVESINKPKDFLDGVVDNSLSRSRMAIGNAVGKQFDIEQAITLSPSFASFVASMRTKGLMT